MRAILSHVNLSHVNLSHVNLSHANLGHGSGSPVRAAPDTAQHTVALSGMVDSLVFLALTLIAIALVLVWLTRPWQLRGGRLTDRIRIAEAVSGYDFWLALRGAGARRRRELRAELRANLWEAAQHVGAKRAIRAVGPLRRLANESVPQPRGPRWSHGLAAGLVALELLIMIQVFVSTIVVDAAQAAGVDRLTVPITLVPGMRTQYQSAPHGGFSFETDFGPAPLVLAVATFLLVSRPWLLARRG